MFVKDSSANKCGVICSSFEIVSSMLMTSEEFTDSKVPAYMCCACERMLYKRLGGGIGSIGWSCFTF